MRLMVVVATMVGFASLGGCNFLNASGGAAARWAAIEDAKAAKETASADGDKICKTMTATGTLMPKRICSTQAEWDAFAYETGKTADAFNQLRDSGSLQPATEGMQHQSK